MPFNVVIGDEIYLKDEKIENSINAFSKDADILKIDLDEFKKVETALFDMYSHIKSYDFFKKSKVGIIRTSKSKNAVSAIEYFANMKIHKDYEENEKTYLLDDVLLILDVYSEDSKIKSSLTKKKESKELISASNVYECFSLKTYEEEKLMPFVEDKLLEFGIEFESDEEKLKSIDYIVKNSKLSYSCAYNEIKKLEFLNQDKFTYEKIVSIISDNLCTDRYYILDKLFSSKSLKESTDILDLYFPKFKKTELEGVLTDLSAFVKDYIVYQNTNRCIRGYNIYKIKNLGFSITSPDDFLLKINSLIRKTREGNQAVLNTLFLSILEHFDYEKV
jgi:hypothetical protein